MYPSRAQQFLHRARFGCTFEDSNHLHCVASAFHPPRAGEATRNSARRLVYTRPQRQPAFARKICIQDIGAVVRGRRHGETQMAPVSGSAQVALDLVSFCNFFIARVLGPQAKCKRTLNVKRIAAGGQRLPSRVVIAPEIVEKRSEGEQQRHDGNNGLV